MKEPLHFTAREIERYHSGQLSAAERHALEKAALDDPFLADAMEGYIHTTTPVTDLAALQQRLQQRIEKQDTDRRIFFMNNAWMKVAAVLLLFTGAGWLVFNTLTTKKDDVALLQTNDKRLAPATTPVADSVIQTPATQEQAPLTATQTADAPPQPSTATGGNSPAANTTPPVAFEEGRKDVPAILNEPSVYKSADKFRDSTAFYNTPAMARQDASADREKKSDTLRNLNVVLQRSEVAPDEVVVVSKGVKPKAKKRMQMVVDTLEPAEGWMRFDDYVSTNLRQPEDARVKQISGSVELSFEVNKEGDPVNITVVKSLCSECDEEAIRLLKQGPKWKSKAKKGKVKIKF